jgi:glutathione S-transferase
MGRYTLYGDRRSGNCYKAALILALTGRSFDWVETDVMQRATRTAEFLAMNPNGKVPVLRLPDGRYLSESNAMLLHLAEGTRYLPQDAYRRALAAAPFFAGDEFSIADIALYAYTHVAADGGFGLEPYPQVRAWLARVARVPGFLGMSESCR